MTVEPKTIADSGVSATAIAADGRAASAVAANGVAPPKPQPTRKPGIKPRDAFNICHEVYVSARELVDSRLPTTQLAGSSKFIWRPDLRPRLVEYVADFALCGERALGPRSVLAGTTRASEGSLRQDVARAQSIGRASRMVLFHVYFLGGAEYQAARRLLGISEINFADWAEEIRERVGRELLRRRVFPPSRYFKVPTSMR